VGDEASSQQVKLEVVAVAKSAWAARVAFTVESRLFTRDPFADI
jgi:hypothetical protein